MNVKTYERGTSIGERLDDVQRVKLEIDRLQSILDEHKAYLLGHAIRNGYDALRCGHMVLTRRERTSWVYSRSIKQAETRLKERKQDEQNDGTAIGSSSEHLVITFDAKAILLDTLAGVNQEAANA
jgi:hypothetical protein